MHTANPHSSNKFRNLEVTQNLFSELKCTFSSERAHDQTLESDLTDASRSLLVGVVASAACQRVPLAGVRSNGVDAVESWFTWLRERCAFINIW